jgi:hypothetical protein
MGCIIATIILLSSRPNVDTLGIEDSRILRGHDAQDHFFKAKAIAITSHGRPLVSAGVSPRKKEQQQQLRSYWREVCQGYSSSAVIFSCPEESYWDIRRRPNHHRPNQQQQQHGGHSRGLPRQRNSTITYNR